MTSVLSMGHSEGSAGGLIEFDIFGSRMESLPTVNRSKLHGKETFDDRL
jgi:hypothetical protein